MISQKEFNKLKFSKKNKKKNGLRPSSPWYYLINKLEKNFLKKNDIEEYFNLKSFKPIKITIKKSKIRKGNGIF